jgi:ABC-type multidrug transport system ATPase subunit
MNVSKSYGSTKALEDVSYSVNEERLALLGHNGAGKSTTFGLLSAQLLQDQGHLYLEKSYHMPYQKQLRKTGICYQDDSLWEGVLVHEILRIFSYLVPI